MNAVVSPMHRILSLLTLLTAVCAAEQSRLLETLPVQPLTPEKTEITTPGKPTGDDAIRLQIFLDESHFGPGVIDGKPGRFTELAAQAWNETHGHPASDWSAIIDAAHQAVPHPTAVTIVPECAAEWVDTELPTDRALQAKKNRMSYRRFSEFMAERYHCNEEYLIALNSEKKINALKPHDSIVVPNVTPFQIETIEGKRHETDPELSARLVVVDTKINQVRIYQPSPTAIIIAEPGKETSPSAQTGNRNLIASFPITPGQDKFIKLGTWTLRGMVEFPWWRYDPTLLDTGVKGPDNEALNIPPGPNSPVGVIWNGTSKPGIGLHGTSDPETIGRARSHGCIRLSNWDAIRLPQFIRPGASIEIR
jgi:lipoprotein-anchoring transpeptidase ErfK/SrfK